MRFKRLIGFLLVAVALSGCAISNTFISYNSRSAKFKSAIDHANESAVLVDLDKKRESKDVQLYMAERARVAQIAQMIDESIFDYKTVLEAIDVVDDKAKMTVTGGAAKAGSAMTNDSVIPYNMDSYEKIMVHHYQALNYIAKGQLEAASIEIRRANFLQSEALEAHTRELAKIEQEAQEKQIDMDKVNLDEKFSAMDSAIGAVKNSFQNAYTFYLSGLVFEASGSRNDAYIDFKKALEINPENIYIQADVLRLARRLGMREDLKRFQKAFGKEAELLAKGQGSVVVFYEEGYAPEKVERKITLPTFSSAGIVSVAMPIYDFQWNAPSPVSISINGSQAGETQLVLALSALAAKALKEEIPGMVVRQIVRAITKSSMQSAASKQNNFAGLAATLINIATERADLRAWSTLPSSVQISRHNLDAGEHLLEFGRNGIVETLNVNVIPGRTSLVYITNTGMRQVTRTYSI